MNWRRKLLSELEAAVPCGYSARSEAASEPTALAGLALQAHGRSDAARLAADWLSDRQAANGSLGVTATQASPCWPTSLAMLLWHAIGDERYDMAIASAIDWTLAEHGKPEKQRPFVGHDTMLIGWSWSADTHSWVEPTAMFVLALKAVGQGDQPRTREAVRLLIDRLLSSGGCNYGNTIVLGQELLPHVQPTGLVMMALAGERSSDPRVDRSLKYLERELTPATTTASLSYGLLGLAAHGRTPPDRAAWLESAYRRTLQQGASPYKLALIDLAASDPYPF